MAHTFLGSSLFEEKEWGVPETQILGFPGQLPYRGNPIGRLGLHWGAAGEPSSFYSDNCICREAWKPLFWHQPTSPRSAYPTANAVWLHHHQVPRWSLQWQALLLRVGQDLLVLSLSVGDRVAARIYETESAVEWDRGKESCWVCSTPWKPQILPNRKWLWMLNKYKLTEWLRKSWKRT